jgi:hypothetical protein
VQSIPHAAALMHEIGIWAAIEPVAKRVLAK